MSHSRKQRNPFTPNTRPYMFSTEGKHIAPLTEHSRAARRQLETYLNDRSKWITYYSPYVICNQSRTLLTKVVDTGIFGGLMKVQDVLAQGCVNNWNNDFRHRQDEDIAIRETFPLKLPFPLYYIFDHKTLYVTDVDVVYTEDSNTDLPL